MVCLEQILDEEKLLVALCESDKHAFSELINQAMSRAAAALSSLLGKPVSLHVPEIELMSADRLTRFFQEELVDVGVTVRQRFAGQLNGLSAIVFSTAHAVFLVRALVGMQIELGRLSAAEQSVLTEMGNVVLNAAVSVLADLGRQRTRLSLPDLTMNLTGSDAADLLLTHLNGEQKAFVLVGRLSIGETELISYLILLMEAEGIQCLLDGLRNHQKAGFP